jgi:hypothetical protein
MRTNIITRMSLMLSFVLGAIACGGFELKPAPTAASKKSTTPQTSNPIVSPSTASTPTPAIPADAEISDRYQTTKITNLESIIRSTGSRFANHRGIRGDKTKIAILDNGFAGLQKQLGKSLPTDLKVEAAPKNKEQDTDHGTKMAQLTYAAATGSSNWSPALAGPDLILFNANGYSNFVHAIDQAIKMQVDVVLYSQVWEYGGNGDGEGFINAQVNRAIASGITWVNAAGNFGMATFSQYVRTDADGQVVLPYLQRFIRVTTSESVTDVKFVLSWNDFANDKDYRTPIDFDFKVFDDRGREIVASNLIQDGREHGNTPGYTDHAREVMKLPLPRGTFFISVSTKNQVLSPHTRIKLTADGYGVRIIDGSREQSLMVPADNPNVIAVGALDAAYSSELAWYLQKRTKPDIWVESRVIMDDGMDVRGTSTAAAIFAGSLALALDESLIPRKNPGAAQYAIKSGMIASFLDQRQANELCRSDLSFANDCRVHFSSIPLVLKLR